MTEAEDKRISEEYGVTPGVVGEITKPIAEASKEMLALLERAEDRITALCDALEVRGFEITGPERRLAANIRTLLDSLKGGG